MKKVIFTLIKSLGFVVFIHAVTVFFTVSMLGVSEEKQVMALFQLLLGIIIISPLYFYLKSKAERPVLYLIFTIALHIIISAATVITAQAALANAGFDIYVFIVTEIIAGIYFALIALIDIGVTVFKKIAHRLS